MILSPACKLNNAIISAFLSESSFQYSLDNILSHYGHSENEHYLFMSCHILRKKTEASCRIIIFPRCEKRMQKKNEKRIQEVFDNRGVFGYYS